jgi:hypothetical protein
VVRAVWSYWHEPFADHRHSAWGSERAHLLAWVLSFETARRHHPDTALVTDSAGARLLVDGLGLDFGTVSLGLDRLDGVDPSWWSIGKLVAVTEQDRPFVHLDADVFLWDPLPPSLVDAPVFVQNPEPFERGGSYYRPEAFEHVLGDVAGSWLPSEWSWHRRPGVEPRGECCGIVGGTHVDLLHHWAKQGLRLVTEPANQAAFDHLHRPPLTITVEQYLLSAIVEHHRGRVGSPFADADIAYLFESWCTAGDPKVAASVGFSHLIADTKRHPANVHRVAERVRRDHPDAYERCCRMT